jgi:hypothetical protein
MERYKRNQVEEAIARVLEPGSSKPTSELRTRIKRLLETDRDLPQANETAESQFVASAFFSEESPGRGREIWFSAYEAFALLVGLHLMRHGWPQGFVVTVLRQVRRELEVAYSTTLAQDPKWLFDQEEIRRNAQAGDFAFDNQDPFLLSIVSALGVPGGNEDAPLACCVKRGQSEASAFAREYRGVGGVWTFFDVVSLAHKVSAELGQTRPQHRGRSLRTTH